MIPRHILRALVFVLPATLAFAAVPASKLYPFGDTDLVELRKLSNAEKIADGPDLTQAWQLYRKLQGSWQPSAPKPAAADIKGLDALKTRLAKQKQPDWFKAALASPQSHPAKIATSLADPLLAQQRETPAYQSLKALALVYLTEHELDRPEAADEAGRTLTALTLTHPWDWEVHALYARLLADAQLKKAGWHTAINALFLNPNPDLNDLKFFAFIGRVTDQATWFDIKDAINAATPDATLAARAIDESSQLFGEKVKTVNIPKKK